MSDKSINNATDSPRILMFSQRNSYKPEVWRCSFDEFERMVQQMDSVDMVAPKPGKYFGLRRRNAQRIGKYSSIALNPGFPRSRLEREYDLFFAVCEKPFELLNVNILAGWKDRCARSVCWLPELWIKEIPSSKAPLKILSKFDHVLLNVARTVKPLSEAIGKECIYLPAGIDTTAFCPYPYPPERLIDVLSIGRRSEKTHQALLKMAREERIFYFHDTLNDLRAYNIQEHRFLMANMAKRSRYFIVNPGKVDTPDETGGQTEFGYRYFEGAAAGTILIGDYPDSHEFLQYFHWPDAVIHLPFGSGKIDEIIKELDMQPARQERIRKKNVVQSLRNHDWVYRWEAILEIAGLEPRNELFERKARLMSLSTMVEEAPINT